ncbi:uncharacterized protein [Anabrus simplex]|uniref:uncharacterized protein n=1 Tax=Anabrus simplex TaxID=316456 RepID=UPI0034DD4801
MVLVRVCVVISVILGALLLCSNFYSGDAANCYECNSYVDTGCDDDIPHETYKTNCSEKYNVSNPLCRKAVLNTEPGLRGKATGEKRVIRSCGWKDTSSANSCRRSSGAGWYQMTCSCIEEYCNSAPRISLPLPTMGMLLLYVLNIF